MKILLVRVAALIAALLAAVATFVMLASLEIGFWPLAMLALAAFLLSAYALLRLGQRWTPGAPARVGRWLIGGTIVYATIAQLTVGNPPERTVAAPLATPATNYWSLANGSRIAYELSAASGPTRGTPIVVLHDGPGLPDLPFLHALGARPFDFISDHGHDVYYYDQLGSGLSGRQDLAKQAPYSVARHVQDLEEIRRTLNAPKLILMGTGWGATLATQYLLQHADHVEKLILESPGPIWAPAWPELIAPAARAKMTDVQSSALATLQRPPLRLVLGRMMADFSLRAAHTFIADWEADQWWTRTTEEAWRLGQPNMTCHTDPSQGIPPLSGLGFFANSYTLADAARLPDPRPALSRMSTDVLIVRGSCDFFDWRVSNEYLKVLPRARYVMVPAAGHFVWLEQPGLHTEIVSAFLRGEAVPLEVYNTRR